jgi:hypothetical protein
LNYLQARDVLAVWKLDRLGRSLKDLSEIVNVLEQRGIGFKSLQASDDVNPINRGLPRICCSAPRQIVVQGRSVPWMCTS